MAEIASLKINVDTADASTKVEMLTQDVLSLHTEINRAMSAVESLRTALHSLTPGSRFPLDKDGRPL